MPVQRRLISILLTAAMDAFVASQGYATEVYEPRGRFAYTVPPGWELRDNPKGRHSAMFRFKMAVDPKSDARIVVTVYDDPNVPLKTRRDMAVQSFARRLKPEETKLATESIFETSSGQHAICLFLPLESRHEWVFFFRRLDRIIVQVDCTTPPDEKYDQLIEATMQTFRITRRE